MRPPLFNLRQISFAYDQRLAIRDLDLTIQSGERLALLGANGSGKSTLLRLLAGLNFVGNGSLEFAGQVLDKSTLDQERFFFAFRRRVGFVFQNPDIQLFNASVFDEVAFAPLHLGLTQSEVRTRVETTLHQMRIGHLKDRAPHRLSGGEKKRVALASVLVMDPDVLLLDEPAGALDPASEAEMLALLGSWKSSSKTVVMATHNLASLEQIADRCCVLVDGQVVYSGLPMQVLHDVTLLEQSGLVRRHKHHHDGDQDVNHPHLHQ